MRSCRGRQVARQAPIDESSGFPFLDGSVLVGPVYGRPSKIARSVLGSKAARTSASLAVRMPRTPAFLMYDLACLGKSGQIWLTSSGV